MKFIQLLSHTRYLVIIPIIGLFITSATLFIFGGTNLISFVIERIGQAPEEHESALVLEVVELVHQFLIGTVLYVIALGLYQLFIQRLTLPGWLQVDNIEELETNLIGMTVVVLAVEFLSVIFRAGQVNLLQYGAGTALPIAALALFIGLRTWAKVHEREHEHRVREREHKMLS